MTAQDVVLARAALGFEVGIEGIPTGTARDWHHEVPAGVTDDPLDFAVRHWARTNGAFNGSLVTFARPTVAIPELSYRLKIGQ